MKFAFTAPLVALVAAVAANAQLTINTPTSAVQCLPQLLTWSGGQPPYFISVLPGSQPSANPLVTFPQQNGTSLTWIVNIQAGTSVGLTIRDSSGLTQNSAPFTIQSGSDSSCLSSSLSAVPGSSTAGGGQTSGSSPTTTGNSAGSSGTSPSSSRSSGSSGTTSGTTQTSSSAAKPFAEIGSAGFLGALVAAIFV